MRFFYLFRKRNLYIMSMVSIFVFSFLMFKNYNDYSSSRITEYSYNMINKYVYELVSSYFNSELIAQNDWYEVLTISKNKDGEILLVDFDLKQANHLNSQITKMLSTKINQISTDSYVLPNTEVHSLNKGIMIEVPFFLNSNWSLLTNLGPRIPVKIELIGSVKTNIKTNVKNYGINNALVEIYSVTTININIVTPGKSQDYILDYDILLDTKLVEGRVPYLYGSNFTSEKIVQN